MEEVIVKNILVFLNRVETKGQEFDEMVACKTSLAKLLKPKEEKKGDKKNG